MYLTCVTTVYLNIEEIVVVGSAEQSADWFPGNYLHYCMYMSIKAKIVDQNNQMPGGVKMMTPGF